MKLKTLAASLGAIGLLAVAAPSYAIPSLTWTSTNYGTQSVDPFGGLEWDSASTAVSVGFDPTALTSVVTTTFWSTANGIKSPSGSTFNTPGITPPGNNPVGWEFTIYATIVEQATCVLTLNGGLPGAGNPCIQSNFFTVGGSYDIYFDPLADANLVTGAGITDGDVVISGSMSPGFAGTFTTTGGNDGSGIFRFRGIVDSTNPLYIAPGLDYSRATSTLQFGDDTGGWTAPSSLPGAAGGTASLPQGYLAFQADGNQTFDIPEPGSLALLGVGLVGFVVGTRRKTA